MDLRRSPPRLRDRYDDLSGIAVVKIDPRSARLPVAALGNSDDVQVGDWAVAVGNPLDVGTSVTLGIISAIHRILGEPEHPLQSLIQTDAAINPGNSGGALANIDREVTGINEAIASPTGGSLGIGFAIPINAAIRIADELIRKQSLKVGDRLTLLVSREGRDRRLTVTLRERPAQFGSS